MIEDKLIKLPIDSIILDERILQHQRADPNYKKCIKELAEKISKDGLLRPIVVVHRQDGSYKLIEGYHRYMACRLLGSKEIDCRIKESVKPPILNMNAR